MSDIIEAQSSIDRVTEYRDLPSIKAGWRCTVAGQEGVIKSGNRACNFNVDFGDGTLSNCHPYWKFKVWNDQGELIWDSKEY